MRQAAGQQRTPCLTLTHVSKLPGGGAPRRAPRASARRRPHWRRPARAPPAARRPPAAPAARPSPPGSAPPARPALVYRASVGLGPARRESHVLSQRALAAPAQTALAAEHWRREELTRGCDRTNQASTVGPDSQRPQGALQHAWQGAPARGTSRSGCQRSAPDRAGRQGRLRPPQGGRAPARAAAARRAARPARARTSRAWGSCAAGSGTPLPCAPARS